MERMTTEQLASAFEKWINSEEPYFPPNDLHYKLAKAAWDASRADIEKERDALKEELFDDNFVAVMGKCKEQQLEIFELKKQLKEFEGAVKVEAYVGDVGSDNSYIYNIRLPKNWAGSYVTVCVKRRTE